MAAKQVLIVRKDLNMRKGKIAAQCAHASLGAVFEGSFEETFWPNFRVKSIPYDNELEEWFTQRFTKICLYVESEDELLQLKQQADEAQLRNFLVTDSGLTEFKNVPTKTVLAIGPARSEYIDKITGDLKLL